MTAVRHLGALALYAALSLWLYGGPLLDGSDTYLGLGNDAEIFMWSFAWWPHAIAEGIDPVVTHAVWAPEGMNLMWATSVPTAAALLAPVTAAWGPVVSWNVAAVATPALAAFTAYLLCAHVARAWAPSLLGGALFGFSSYVAGQQLGHLHMTAVFLVPLGALLVVRRCERSIGRWWFVALFAAAAGGAARPLDRGAADRHAGARGRARAGGLDAARAPPGAARDGARLGASPTSAARCWPARCCCAR